MHGPDAERGRRRHRLHALDAGHYDVDDEPPFKDGKPGGWHKAGASIWNDLGAACIPHAAI
ncbi:hypothetical protein GCM10010353_71300 [Streptomyces chryseus]|nr:hypothetical protein GCM10010353_71300 [Streptomyces chryseus]